jgi:uncharacterized protein
LKLIKTKQANYLLDSYSNSLVKVDELTEEQLDSEHSSIRKFFIDKGLFSETYEPKFMDFSFKNLRKSLESELGHIILNVTNQCNLRCQYCAFSGIYPKRRMHSDEMMSDETAFRAIDFFLARTSNSKRIAIGFYGGEPLFNFKLIKKIVQKVKCEYGDLEDKIFYSLTTNGLLLKSEIMDFLVENKFSITVSLDGPKSIHDKWRITEQKTPSFDLIMENIRKLKEKNLYNYQKCISFEATIMPPFDILEVNRFFITHDLAKGINSRYNYVNRIDEENDFDVDKEEVKKNNLAAKKFLLDKIVKREYDDIANLISLWFPTLRRIHNRQKLSVDTRLNNNGICNPGSRRLFVNCSGEFFICEKLDYAESIGSIEKGFDYERIENIIKAYLEEIKTNCGNCWARYYCSLCYTSIVDNGCFNTNLKSQRCKNLKRRVEKAFVLYLALRERDPEAFDDFLKATGLDNAEAQR